MIRRSPHRVARPDAARRRRGSVYVAVLGVAMLVTIIGLSALAAVRIQRDAAAGADEVVTARLYAESAVDVVLHRLANDANWRTTYVNDQWTADEEIVKETFRYKLVDEIDGDLADDDTEPVRLYTRATVGDATRICSVVLQKGQSPAVTNLFTNADMENGTNAWYVEGTGDVASSSTDPHGGASCLHIYNRANYWSVPAQDISAFVQNGTAYDFSIWVKVDTTTQQATPQIVINSSGNGWRTFDPNSVVCTAGTWTEVTSTITPSWSGDLLHASARVGTQTSHQFWLDDAVLMESGAPPPALKPVRGTWQRAVE